MLQLVSERHILVVRRGALTIRSSRENRIIGTAVITSLSLTMLLIGVIAIVIVVAR